MYRKMTFEIFTSFIDHTKRRRPVSVIGCLFRTRVCISRKENGKIQRNTGKNPNVRIEQKRPFKQLRREMKYSKK